MGWSCDGIFSISQNTMLRAVTFSAIEDPIDSFTNVAANQVLTGIQNKDDQQPHTAYYVKAEKKLCQPWETD